MGSSRIEIVLSELLQSAKIKDLLRDEYFLYSIWPFYDSPRRRQQLEEMGIHNFTEHEGPVLLDSGGFQLYRKNAQLDFHQTLEIYENAQLTRDDFAIALDFVPFPDESPHDRMRKIEKSKTIYSKMVTANPKIIPVIHGWTKKEIAASLTQIEDEHFGGFLAYGSGFPMMTKYNRKNLQGSIRNKLIFNFVEFLRQLRRKNLDGLRIHVLGANGQNSAHLCWYAGCDQTDSGAWRLKAAYGKISFVGVAEAKISKRASTFGVTVWKEKHDRLLQECECPVCNGLSLSERKFLLAQSFKARAIHNAYIYLNERDLAREMVGTLRYRRYLEKRFKGRWWAKFLAKINESRHQKEILQYLK